MKTFLAVYNMVSSDFFTPTVTTLKEFMSSDDFVSIGSIQAKDVEDAYRILNIAHPIEIVKFIEDMAVRDSFCQHYESLHTSMSVGDVLVEYVDNGKVYHMCDRHGWIILK